jgi:hypothetical protein
MQYGSKTISFLFRRIILIPNACAKMVALCGVIPGMLLDTMILQTVRVAESFTTQNPHDQSTVHRCPRTCRRHPPPLSKLCIVSGCSGEICTEQDIASICVVPTREV